MKLSKSIFDKERNDIEKFNQLDLDERSAEKEIRKGSGGRDPTKG